MALSQKKLDSAGQLFGPKHFTIYIPVTFEQNMDSYADTSCVHHEIVTEQKSRDWRGSHGCKLNSITVFTSQNFISETNILQEH